MKRIYPLAGSIICLTAGLAKMSAQASSQANLLVPTCLGQSIALPVGAPESAWLHCWGCYAAALGVAGMIGIVAHEVRQRRLRRFSALS